MSAKKVEGSSAPAIRRDPYEVLSGTHLDQKDPKITHSDGFSMADLRKSILIDGLSTADLQRSIYSMVDLQKSYFKRCAKKATEPESSNSVMGTDNIVAEVVKPKGRQPAKKKAPAAKPGTYLDQKEQEVTITDFVYKELILSFIADLQRSIPSMVDGFKPVQRRILFCAFKKNLVEEIIVSQFSSSVALLAYYEGWQSVASTIVRMAQDYVGSNNINLFVPAGQFGSRWLGGKDAADARCMYTRPSPITRVLFPKDDDVILNYLNKNGKTTEPTWYMPIIPTVLVNGFKGSKGKGTAWSTFIPNYNPREIVANIRRLLNGQSMVPMDPWYRGFKGTIEKTASNEVGSTYTVTGLYEEVDDTCIRITELPIGKWTSDYKEFVTSSPLLQDHMNYSDDISVDFDLILSEETMAVARKRGFLKTFKLTTTISTSNMHLFDKDGVPKKYATPEQILVEFFELRLKYYELRKKIRLENLKLEMLKLDNKVKFILEVLSGHFTVIGLNKAKHVQLFREKGFTPLPKKATPVEAAVTGAIDDAAEESSMAPEPNYDYLLEMSSFTFTYEKSQELLAERNKMKEAVAELEKTTPISLWHRDLEALDKELDKLDSKHAEVEEKRKAIKAKNGTTEARKQPAKKAVTKKAIEPESSNSAMDTDNIAEKGTTAVKESQNEDNELCAVRDAFETMMSPGLSDYQKKLQLKKLMNLGTGKRKELSDEWKALCVEEGRLNIKKLRFSAKLAEVASDT